MKNTLRSLLKDLAKVTGKKIRSYFGKEEKPKKTLKQRLLNNKGKLLAGATLVGGALVANNVRKHLQIIKEDNKDRNISTGQALSAAIHQTTGGKLGDNTGLLMRSKFGVSRFGEELSQNMSDEEKKFLGTTAGVLATGAVLSGIGHKKQKEQMDKLHDKLDLLEKRFKKCNIPFEKIEKKYFVKWNSTSWVNTNIPERIEKLKEALRNKSNFTNFGTNLDDYLIKNPNKSMIAIGAVTGGLMGGISYALYRRNVKKYKKGIKKIEEQLNKICKHN